jgi:hypothetical protein
MVNRHLIGKGEAVIHANNRACMPHFLPTLGDARRPPVGAVIIEAPSMSQARMTTVVRRLAPGVPFGEGLKLSAKMMTAIPPEEIGRMMSCDISPRRGPR